MALYLCFHSMHIKYLILIFYMRDTLWPTPPASGGMGSSPLRSETNAAYLVFSESVGHCHNTRRMEMILLTFWSGGRSRRRKRTASYSSARAGDVRHGSRATVGRKDEKKRERWRGWRMADVRILGFGASKPLSLSYYYIYIPLDDDPRP